MIKENINKKIGNRLRECRSEKHITQNQLAEQSGCVPQTISYIENGKRGISRELAHKFSQILCVDERYLLCETDYKTFEEERKANYNLFTTIESLQTDYIRTLGYEITFGESNPKMAHYVSPEGVGLFVSNTPVIINGVEINYIDYITLLEDLNTYTRFLISQLPRRKERRLGYPTAERFDKNK